MEGTKVLIVKSKEEKEKITNLLMSFWIKLEKLVTFPPIRWVAGFFTSRESLNMRIKMLENFVAKYKRGIDALFYNAPIIAFLLHQKRGNLHSPKTTAVMACFPWF